MSTYSFDTFDFGYDAFDGCFDALFEGLHGVRAAAAVALKAHHDDAFVGHVDIFDVAAVLLQVGAYLGQGVLYFFFDCCFLFVGHNSYEVWEVNDIILLPGVCIFP